MSKSVGSGGALVILAYSEACKKKLEPIFVDVEGVRSLMSSMELMEAIKRAEAGAWESRESGI